jgi:membrane associated rhomboid family serine protease
MANNNQGNFYRPPMFGGFQFFPPVVKSLLIANVAVFVLMLFLDAFHIGNMMLNVVFNQLFALMPLGYGFYPWQLITYQFMHAGFLHLLFNMLPLWMLGKELENIWGSKKFLIYYLSCGIIAGLANLFVTPLITSVAPTVGASGAIFAVLIAFAMMFPDSLLILIPIPIPVKAKYFVIFYILLETVSIGSMDGIAHIAHLGGALAGFLYVLFDRRRLMVRRTTKPFQSWTKSSSWSHPSSTVGDVVDAKVYDISEAKTYEPKNSQDDAQKRIDDILDKISRNGYQSLTEEEKKILFEASKKMN